MATDYSSLFRLQPYSIDVPKTDFFSPLANIAQGMAAGREAEAMRLLRERMHAEDVANRQETIGLARSKLGYEQSKDAYERSKEAEAARQFDKLMGIPASGGSAAVRNNNPGAMWPGPSSQRFGATSSQNIAGNNKIATFPDAESGAAAQFDLLSRNYSGMRLSDAVRRWSGGNSSREYVASVARATGLQPDTVITPELLQSPAGIDLTRAMAKVEAGGEYPMSPEQWASAQSRAFGTGRQAPVPATPLNPVQAEQSVPPGGVQLAQSGGSTDGLLVPQQPDPNAPLTNVNSEEIDRLSRAMGNPSFSAAQRAAIQARINFLQSQVKPSAVTAVEWAKETAKKTAEAEVKKKFEFPEVTSKVQSLSGSIDELVNTAKQIKNDPELWRTTGPLGKLWSRPGGQAYKLDTAIETLKSKIGVDTLTAMREASKTGGAVGNVTEKEWPILQGIIASLDQGLSEKDFKANLNKIIAHGTRAKIRTHEAFYRQYPNAQGDPTIDLNTPMPEYNTDSDVAPPAPPEPQAPVAPVQPDNTMRQASQPAGGGRPRQTPTAGAVIDGYRFKGGNPADPNSWEPGQ